MTIKAFEKRPTRGFANFLSLGLSISKCGKSVVLIKDIDSNPYSRLTELGDAYIFKLLRVLLCMLILKTPHPSNIVLQCT